MTPGSQSVSKGTATYQGYLVTSLEHQGMMQNVLETIRSIWKIVERGRGYNKGIRKGETERNESS